MRPIVIQAHSRPLTKVEFNREGDLLLTCGKDNKVCVYRTEDNSLIGEYEPHGGSVSSLSITADSKYLVTAAWDGYVRVFDVLSGHLLCEMNMIGMVRVVEWCQNPTDPFKFVLIHDGFAKEAKNTIVQLRFNPKEESIEVVNKIREPLDALGKHITVAYGPFDKTIAASDEDGNISIFDAETGEVLNNFKAHSAKVSKLHFTADRMLCLSCSRDMTAKLWDCSNPKEWKLAKVYESDRPLNDAQICPLYRDESVRRRQHILLGGGQDAKEVTTTKAKEGRFESVLYHLVYGEELGKVGGHFGPINTIAWSPDAKGFATGGEDGFVRLNWFDKDYLEGEWNE